MVKHLALALTVLFPGLSSAAEQIPFVNSENNSTEVGVGYVLRSGLREYMVVVSGNDQRHVLDATLQVGAYVEPKYLGRPAIIRAQVRRKNDKDVRLEIITADGAVHPDEHDSMFELRKLGAGIKRNKEGRINSVSLGRKRTSGRTLEELTVNDLRLLKPLTELESLSLAEVTDEGLLQLSDLTNVESVQIGSTALTSAGLRGLVKSTNLGILNLRLPNLTDSGLAHFSHLKSLWCLRINGSKITSDGLAYLSELTGLRVLEVNDTQVGNAGLKHLSKLSELEQLFLAGTPITDDALVMIPTLKKLWALKLDRTAITDRGLENFREFESLRGVQFVYLVQTRITDAGLSHLSDMTRLEGLQLDKNQITDTGLRNLQPHKHLKWVSARGGKISKAAATKFREERDEGFYLFVD